MTNNKLKMKKMEKRNILFVMHYIGVAAASIALFARLLFDNKQTCIALWVLSIVLFSPYIIYKQLKQENWTNKDLWPNALLAVVCIIYLIINNK